MNQNNIMIDKKCIWTCKIITRFLIKHINSDGTTIYDDNYHFKVVR